MKQPQTTGARYLVALNRGSEQTRRIPLTKEHLVVGRAPTSDVRFDDANVSRTHAALWQGGGVVYVQDLGSSGGTFVNGVPVTAPRQLRSGDVVAFSSVQLRYQDVGDETGHAPIPHGPSPRSASSGPSVGYHIGQQQAGAINNVGRDQYNSHVQQIHQQRESFLREIAATKTRARWLIWMGFLLLVVGFGVFAAGIVGFLGQASDAVNSGDLESPGSPFGQDIAGIPSGLLGWGLAAGGTLMLVVGIVLHVVATSRRKRVDREYSVQPPWRAPVW